MSRDDVVARARQRNELAAKYAKMQGSVEGKARALKEVPVTAEEKAANERWDKEDRAGAPKFSMVQNGKRTIDSAERREPPTIDSIGEEKGLAAGKPVNTEWLRLDKLTPEALAAEAKSEGIKGEGKTDLIMAILRKNFSTAQFDAWSLFY
jgi:hypothetical protein